MQRANRNRDTRYVVHIVFDDGETTQYEADRIQAIQNVLQLTRFDPNTPDDVYRAIHVVSIPLSSLHEWVEEDRNPLCGKLYVGSATGTDMSHVVCELNVDHLDNAESHAAVVTGGLWFTWAVNTMPVDRPQPLLADEDAGDGKPDLDPIFDNVPEYNPQTATAEHHDPYAPHRRTDPYGGAGVL